jgi:hypothetical protein
MLMKKLYLLVIALLIANALISQSCLPEGLNLYSQAEIDNFKSNYPNCTQIEGHLEISGSGITNLDSLHLITSVGGYLDIYSIPDLVSLDGLSALTTVGSGRFGIHGSALTNLNGLDNLASVPGLRIEQNPSLTSLQGLSSLTTVNEGIYILDNPLLESLNGLESITSVGQGGTLIIEDNAILSSLSGIDNIVFNPLYQVEVWIRNNPLLSVCEVESICKLLDDDGIIYLENNAVGCTTMDEVISACGTSVDELMPDQGISIYPNPVSSWLTVELSSDAQYSSYLQLSSLNGQEIEYVRLNAQINKIDLSKLPAGIYIVKVWNDNTVRVQKVLVE